MKFVSSSTAPFLRRFLYPQSRRTFISLPALSTFSGAQHNVGDILRPQHLSTTRCASKRTIQRLKSSMPAYEEERDIQDCDQQLLAGLNNKKTVPFLLADIGEGIAEVEILQWFVQPGDTVRQFDRVCEVQSDKATVEITSRFDGIVASIAHSDDMVAVGTPLMHIIMEGTDSDDDDDDVDESGAQQAGEGILNNVNDEEDKLHIPTFRSSVDDAIEEIPKKRQKPKVKATPAVRKLSMDYGLELGNIVGSGPNGRVLKGDVLQILRDKGLLESEVTESEVQAEKGSSNLATPSQLIVQDEIIPIRGYNRLMVKTMTESLSIPHMCYADEINMNAVLQARTAMEGIKLSVLPFAIKAASLAIRDYPVLNSSISMEEMQMTLHANHNIGVAMDTPRGLAVPVVKDCQNLPILEIADELQRLKTAATEGTLCERDISGATFTLSNIGAIGGTYMSPIVAAPQVAIGAMGKIQRLPRFSSSTSMEIEEVNIMQISWGGDHRVIDGATLARFSNRWKDLMENPMSMVFCMK